MPNNMAAQLASLGIDFTYAFDEAAGDSATFANGGNGAAYPLSMLSSEQTNPGPMPGMIRGLPHEYGFWLPAVFNANPSLGAGAEPSLNANLWDTGCIMFVGMFNDFIEDATVLDWVYNNSPESRFARLSVLANGLVRFDIFDNGGGTRRYQVTTQTPLEPGEPYLIMVYQRADNTGIHIKIDDVDQTLTVNALTGDGVDLNSWFSEILVTTPNHTDTDINNQNRAGTWSQGANWMVQRPGWWLNSVPTDAQMTSLFNDGCNFDGIPQEIMQYVASLATNGNPNYVYPVITTQRTADIDSNVTPVWAPVRDDGLASNTEYSASSYVPRSGDFMANSQWNTNTEIVNEETGQFRYGQFEPSNLDVSPTISTNQPSNFDGAETTGTVMCLVEFDDGIPVGVTAGIWQLVTNNVGNAYIQLKVGVTTGPIYSTIIEVVNSNGDFYQRTSVGEFTTGDTVFFAITQDGSDLTIYIDGNQVSSVPSTNLGSIDSTSWIADLPQDSTAGLPQEVTIAGSAGSAVDIESNSLGFFAWLPNALTETQIANVYNALLFGSFPEDSNAQPSDDGFAETIATLTPAGRIGDPGPWHWWRLNESDGLLPVDTGVAPVSGTTITQGGDPDYDVQGPLILDPTNAAIYFDGVGDYFEVGVDGVPGELVTSGVGSVGFFISQKDLDNDNIAYSQSNDTATTFIQFGVNNGFLEFYIQTGVGNSATYTSSIQITDFDYVFGVFNCDGSSYEIYVNGALDVNATLTLEGAAAAGEWFSSAPATRSAIAARADNIFTTETTARFSELFIFEFPLSASQIAALFDAATQDGIAGATNTNLRIDFEDVIFRNGGLADVRVINPRADFNIALQVDRCRFLGGAEQDAGASVLLSGAVNGQINGSIFDLEAQPTTGRTAVKGTTEDPTTEVDAYYSLLVADSTLQSMGRSTEPAIYLESGFSATIKGNTFLDSFGSVIGWRGGAQGVNALRNLIDGLDGQAAILVQNGLNTSVGRSWQIVGNTILDAVNGRGISIEGYNSQAAGARHILIARNKLVGFASEGIYLSQIRDARVAANYIEGGERGIELDRLLNVITVSGNQIKGFSDEAVYLADPLISAATLVIDGNKVTGTLTNDAFYVDGIINLQLLDNVLINIGNGIQLGDITTAAQVHANTFQNTTTPIALLFATSQEGLEIGPNNFGSLGDVELLTVTDNEINVLAGYHEITSDSAVDLNIIGGALREGRIVALRVADGSSAIIAKDGVGDMQLAGDFIMSAGDTIWLVQDNSGVWDELSRSDNT